MRIFLTLCLFLMACNPCSKDTTAKKDNENTTQVSDKENTNQQKAEANIKQYAADHSKGKPGAFDFGKLEKISGSDDDEAFQIKCTYKETYDDGNPADMKEIYYLDKELNVKRTAVQ